MSGMRTFTITDPREEHLDYLAENARPEDVAEIYALTDSCVRESIGSLTPGEKFVALNEGGVPFAVFGIRPVEREAPFLFASGGVARLRQANPELLANMRAKYPAPGRAVGGTALIWMIGTREVAAYRREMLVYGSMIIQDWLRECSCLCNIVHAANKPAIRMLRKWGFTVLPAAPFGPRARLFHPFFMRRTGPAEILSDV